MSLVLLWVAVLGYPVAWHKSDIGQNIRWIGAQFNLSHGNISVTIPQDKVDEIHDTALAFCRTATVSKKRLRSACGSLSFVSGLVCFLRPFCSSMWAALSSKRESVQIDASRNQGVPPSKRKKRLPDHMVFTKQIRHSLLWLLAFFSNQFGPLERHFPLQLNDQHSVLHISTDASPWGLGGVLVVDGKIESYFFDKLTSHDLRRFNGSIGVSDFNTIWEALAILVAIRTWRTLSHSFAELSVRSDSLSAIRALVKLASPDPNLNLIARELALDCAELLQVPAVYEHTPGIANKLPDALSRMHAPTPALLPDVLRNINRAGLEVRDSSFWRSAKLPHGASWSR